MKTYTKKEIKTLIHIKKNGCEGIGCENCPIDPDICLSTKLRYKILSNQIAKLTLKKYIFRNLHKKTN